jgi:hypothetical protein
MIRVLAPLAFLALLGSTAGPTPPPINSVLHGAVSSMPTEDQQLEARVTKLEKEIATLTADNAAMKAHVHTFLGPRNPSQYMSLHDIAVAIQPHSNTDTTVYWVPMYVSSGAPPSLSGIHESTSTPTSAP